ncbi:acyl carrier protein [Cytobacillus horneckiae]|uniref:Acyl carrier protein n=1 Tax=Cytobacillus horneckiae TaxID=549687 RepID=A0A2N0ZGE1_9BACI|nr:acyl carrier protein [Cytobacillus horneckiae]MBN6886071.1 acyl carrier protein [Cytobacillus horneckiae]MCM3176375.1 acyl carrier protein [Cytobacillus horneckiae]MEC1155791.1 acyl carrier protein [Cytobacillus horneckiae]MED2939330.1 acyl carrier protein [Cytobacillus horneckiae]PKG28553.1 acyl carrier protein [Cytobacillus horneckiae]
MDELIKEKVIELFAEVYGVNLKEDIDGDTILFGPDSPYNLDSMDVLRIISILKDEYKLEINAMQITNFNTLNKMVDFIKTAMPQEAS